MTKEEIINNLNESTSLEAVDFVNGTDTCAESIGNSTGVSLDVKDIIEAFNIESEQGKKDILTGIDLHVIHLGGRPTGR